MKSRRLIFRLVQIVVITVILFFVVGSLVKNWNVVRQYTWQINYFWLAFSFLLGFLSYVFLVFIWREVLRSSGSVPSFGRIYRVWFLSNIGRYLPGKVWTFLGVVYLLENEGITPERSLYTSILAQAMSVISGFVLAVVFLSHEFYSKLNHNLSVVILTLILFLGLMVLVIFPKVLIWFVNFVLKLLKRQLVKFDLKRKNLSFFFLLYTFSWLLFGLSFFIFIKSITPLSWNLYFILTAAFSGSITLGFLAVFSPGGIGVREGILSGILSIYFPLGISAVISLLSRIWMTLLEVISLFVGLGSGFWGRSSRTIDS